MLKPFYSTNCALKIVRTSGDNYLLDEDADLSEAYEIDQSAYSHLDTFDELARKNAGRLIQQMEIDSF